MRIAVWGVEDGNLLLIKDAEQGALAMIIWRMNEEARDLSLGCYRKRDS